MNSNQKFWAGVFLGAAAGTALTVFFTSDKGKEVIADAKEKAEKIGSDIKSKLQHLDDELKSLLKKGKDIAEDLENTAAESFV